MTRDDLAVVIPGPSTVRSLGDHVLTLPSTVCLDRHGRVVGFARDSSEDPTTQRPFDSAEVLSPGLALAYMRWLLRRGRRGGATVLLVPAAPRRAMDSWRSVADRLPGPAVVMLRPMAAASGLGLDVDSGAPALVVELRGDGVEAAVVGDSAVIDSIAIEERSLRAITVGVARLLGRLDPDVEGEVRSRGAHLLAESGWPLAAELERRLDVRVWLATDPIGALVAGVLADREIVGAYLAGIGPQRARPSTPVWT